MTVAVSRARSRALLWHYRFFSGEKASTSYTSHLDAVKAKDERIYGGLKSWDILTSERHAHGVRDVTQKPLWHVWQLLTASAVPICAWYYLEQVEASGRRAGLVALEERDDDPHTQPQGQQQDGTLQGTQQSHIETTSAQLAESLSRLEQRIAHVERRLDAQHTDST